MKGERVSILEIIKNGCKRLVKNEKVDFLQSSYHSDYLQSSKEYEMNQYGTRKDTCNWRTDFLMLVSLILLALNYFLFSLT